MNRLMGPCSCVAYLIQMKPDLITCLQVVRCSHLMDHIPPRLDHGTHRVGHILRDHTGGGHISPQSCCPPVCTHLTGSWFLVK